MSTLPPGERHITQEPNPESDIEEITGMKAGYADQFLQEQISSCVPREGDAHQELNARSRKEDVLTSIQDLLMTNPYLSAKVRLTIEGMINSFTSQDRFHETNGREEELAMLIATYLHSLPSTEKGKQS